MPVGQEGRRQKAEGGRRKAEGRRQKTEGCGQCARRGKGAHSVQKGQEETIRARVELQSTL